MDQQDVIVVGAGFGGMYMLHRIRALGLTAKVIEAGSEVGGTWYWNRYPGARCDIESMSYSYSFSQELEQEWDWPDRYALQADILRYARHVADRFDLRRDISFDTRVESMDFDETARRWTVTTDKGEGFRARWVVMATGCLSVPKTPDIPGLERFQGPVYHTARWPLGGVDFTDRSVGIVGTGSSAIQAIPLIAWQARHLTVFQRTANYSIPAWNGPLSEETSRQTKRNYPALRRKSRNSCIGDFADESYLTILKLTPEEREFHFERCWRLGGFNMQYAFADIMESAKANELVGDFVRRKIRATVSDPGVAERLCPKGHPFGAKRLCVDTGYYETYNRSNVCLVDIKSDPIETLTPTGFRTHRDEHGFDDLVLATGFDAMTGALAGIDIRGRGGQTLAERWQDGPAAYLGLAVAGFPNMFIVTGPGSPSVLANVLMACEQHVEWIGDLLERATKRGVGLIEAEPGADNAWARKVSEAAERTVYPKANSWYVGANVPVKPRVFMPYAEGFGTYSAICDRVASNDYEGFRLTSARSDWAAQ
jgi:cyclohexanone monooxygenase